MAVPQNINQLWNMLVGGTGVVVTKYPVSAAGVSLTASGSTTGAYKFAAAGANVKSVVAKAVITSVWRIVGFALNTFSTTGVFVIRIGKAGTAGAALTAVLGEYVVNEISAAGLMSNIPIPFSASVTIDGLTDGLMCDAASANAGQDDTVVFSGSVMTGMGN